jgi:hypothetical protein
MACEGKASVLAIFATFGKVINKNQGSVIKETASTIILTSLK